MEKVSIIAAISDAGPHVKPVFLGSLGKLGVVCSN
jgi:hypothetical protein